MQTYIYIYIHAILYFMFNSLIFFLAFVYIIYIHKVKTFRFFSFDDLINLVEHNYISIMLERHMQLTLFGLKKIHQSRKLLSS